METHGGGDHVDFERLRQIDGLFAHRWDVFVIATLAGGPLRFSQLSYDVCMHTRTKIPDSTLVRIRDRLTRAGIMSVANDEDGHAAYALTVDGQATAEIIAAITHALDERRKSAREQSDPSRAA
jgi:DNA-binding HxlR family transcriptional regulator